MKKTKERKKRKKRKKKKKKKKRKKKENKLIDTIIRKIPHSSNSNSKLHNQSIFFSHLVLPPPTPTTPTPPTTNKNKKIEQVFTKFGLIIMG